MSSTMNFGVNLNMFLNSSGAQQGMNSFFGAMSKGFDAISAKVKNQFSNFNSGKFFSGMAAGFNMLDKTADKFFHTLFNIKTLMATFAGGGIVGFFTHDLLHTATELEGVYARLMTVFGGDTNRVREHFKGARKFEMENPIYNLEQIHESTANLAMMGLAKTEKQAALNRRYIADFVAGKRITNGANGSSELDLVRGTQIITQAAIAGSFRRLMYQGITQKGLPNIARNAVGTFEDIADNNKIKSRREELVKLLPHLAAGKKGTDEYANAMIRFLGVMESGAAKRMSLTIGGSMQSIHNMFTMFKLDIVGASQETGTFAHAVAETFSDNVKKIRDAMPAIGRIAFGLGSVFRNLWQGVSNYLGSATDKLVNFVHRIDEWFKDWKNNVAPFIVFLYIIKIRIEDFFKGFKEGFMASIGTAWKVLSPFISLLGKMFDMFGSSNENKIKNIGEALGKMTGYLLAWKAVSPVIHTVGSVIGTIGRVTGIGGGAGGLQAQAALAEGNFQYVWVLNMGAGGMGGLGGLGSGILPGIGGAGAAGLGADFLAAGGALASGAALPLAAASVLGLIYLALKHEMHYYNGTPFKDLRDDADFIKKNRFDKPIVIGADGKKHYETADEENASTTGYYDSKAGKWITSTKGDMDKQREAGIKSVMDNMFISPKSNTATTGTTPHTVVHKQEIVLSFPNVSEMKQWDTKEAAENLKRQMAKTQH